MRGKKRREIRRILREASLRARGEAPPSPAGAGPFGRPPPGPTPAQVQEMACLCGELLRISSALNEKRCSCPSCGRKFVASFATDRHTGREILSPIYLDDGMTTGGTFAAEIAPHTRPSQAPAHEEILDGLSPEPPAELSFVCGCGQRLKALRAHYDKRVQCGKCGRRLLLALVYDSEKKSFRIESIRLSDAPSGETNFLDI